MKKFLAVFTGTPASRAATGWNALDPRERQQREQAGMQAWMEWGTRNKVTTAFDGGPLGSTKLVGPKGISDTRNNLAGFTVIEAESLEAAAKLFQGHPHFSIFPGDGVEVMEVMPIPGT